MTNNINVRKLEKEDIENFSNITKISLPTTIKTLPYNVSFPSSSTTFNLYALSNAFCISLPYLFSSNSLKTLNAIVGSVVVPDFEITLTEKSLPSQSLIVSAKALEEIVLPAKKICGLFK